MIYNMQRASLTNSSDKIPTVTGNTFKPLVLEGTGPIAVEFMSYGCEHCGTIEPILQQVAEMVKAKGKIYRVNVAVDPELGDRYAVKATPTLVMFMNGRQVGKVEGPRPTVASVLTAVAQPFRAMT